ncbi:MAG TPA: rod shape-determining protein MreD [Pontiella sp.]
MKRRILMIVTIICGALLQQILPVWPIFGGIKPPILAALSLHYALRRDNRDMWLAVITAALLHDGLEVGPFGPAIATFPIIGFLANRIRTEVFADDLPLQLMFGAVIGLFVTLVTLLAYSAFGLRPFHFGMAVLRLIGGLILGMTTLPIISHMTVKLESILPKSRGHGWL